MSTVERSARMLSLQLFGPTTILVNRQSLPEPLNGKERLLLALLALKQGASAQPNGLERVALCSMLYPATEESAQAQVNLRKLLWQLRKKLGSEADRLSPPRSDPVWIDLAGAEVDVFAFDAAIQDGAPERLRHAIDLYSGPLLPECELRWVARERERRRQRFHAAVQNWSAHILHLGDLRAALDGIEQARRLDWEWEPTLHVQMETLMLSDDQKAVHQVYTDFVSRLWKTHRRHPHSDTEKKYRHLLNTPLPPSSQQEQLEIGDLIGRDRDLRSVIGGVRTHSLVTLTGPGGVGKTRLALQAAVNLNGVFADGCIYVDLAVLPRLANETTVARVVAEALTLREEAGRSLLHVLVTHLQERQLLLLLDNCEHVVAASASLVEKLLARCSRLRILATSQHPLRLAVECEWAVDPLETPEPELLPALEADVPAFIRAFPSVQLFVARAQEVDRSFALTSENARAIAYICHSLDGLPLAILLAAVRVRGLSVGALATRLAQRFRLLTQGERTAPLKQQTLEATIDWSYALLSPQEQLLLCRLPVFRGGCTLEAVEGVCAGEDIVKEDIALLLCGLVEKSLVVKENGTAETRYRLLESIRQYSQQRLSARPDAASLYWRHACWFVDYAESMETGLRGAGQLGYLRKLDAEHENLRAALETVAQLPEGEDSELRLVGALWLFWWIRGHFREGSQRSVTAVRHRTQEGRVRAKALLGAAILTDYAEKPEQALGLLQEALDQAEKLRDRWLVGLALLQMGHVLRRDWQKSSGYLNDALSVARQVGDDWLLTEALSTFGFVEFFHGNQERARMLLQEGLERCRILNDPWLLGELYYHCGLLAMEERNYPEAQTLMDASLKMTEELRDRQGSCLCHLYLGRLRYYAQEDAAARDHFVRGLHLSLELEYARGVGLLLDGFVLLAFRRGEWERAARLFGAAERQRIGIRPTMLTPWREEQSAILERLHQVLGPVQYSIVWEEGKRMTAAQAAEYACQTSLPTL